MPPWVWSVFKSPGKIGLKLIFRYYKYPGCRLASSKVTGNGCYFASYRQRNFNFFILCRSVAVLLTICKLLSKSLGGKSSYS